MGLWNTRRFFSMNALFVMFSVIIYNGSLSVAFMTLAVQVSVSFEVWSIGIQPELERHVPYLNKLRWYILITWHFILDGWVLMDLFLQSNNRILLLLFQNHLLFAFILTLFGLICFAVKLNQHSATIQLLQYQYGQFVWALSSVVIIAISAPALRLSFDGLIWTVLPMLTVVANDIFAYVFGKLFGKHPLTLLSPKKTWEGYVYSGMATIPFGYCLAHIFMKYNVLLCPVNEFSFGLVECEVDAIFVKMEYDFYGYVVHTEPFQIYNALISLFVATVCPVGGFLASGYKRAFGLKNYGSLIPGHGGVTDRMDAEMLMCGFVPLLYKIIMMKKYPLSVDEIETEITSSLTNEEMTHVIKVLESLLN